MLKKNVLVWFRNDLRLHDNEALTAAINQAHKNSASLLTLYCFDRRQFGLSRIGRFSKTGKLRTKFIQQSVRDLRSNLQKIGLDVMIRVGIPEKIIPELVDQHSIGAVYVHKEVTQEETDVENALQKELNKRKNVEVNFIWGHTMIHRNDLPFTIEKMPEVFTAFRTKVERDLKVRNCFEVPSVRVNKLQNIDWGQVPSYCELGFEDDKEPIADERSALVFNGGETEGLQRVKYYLWDSDHLKTYKETRNGLVGEAYSSKFSPWLSVGALSPRFIYHQVKQYETERAKNESTYWLVFELLWRDFFRFFGEKSGNSIFMLHGIRDGYRKEWNRDMSLFKAWKEGKTGHPFVDANMRELLYSGWMSNRGRQNVVSYLAKDLGVDWRLGAEWFESQLIDYDVTSNWLNWMYTAGVGNDPRGEARYFNVIKQGYDYDFDGKFVKLWCPELAKVPQPFIHMPYKMSSSEQQKASCIIGSDYPAPISTVRPPPSLKQGSEVSSYKHKMRGNPSETVGRKKKRFEKTQLHTAF